MKGLAKGMTDNIGMIENAASKVSGTIEGTISGRVGEMEANAATVRATTYTIDGDTIVLDGKAIGKSATKYITTEQTNNQAAKGRRMRHV